MDKQAGIQALTGGEIKAPGNIFTHAIAKVQGAAAIKQIIIVRERFIITWHYIIIITKRLSVSRHFAAGIIKRLAAGWRHLSAVIYNYVSIKRRIRFIINFLAAGWQHAAGAIKSYVITKVQITGARGRVSGKQ